jgi:membrane fusion protein (multidrug efflux system)
MSSLERTPPEQAATPPDIAGTTHEHVGAPLRIRRRLPTRRVVVAGVIVLAIVGGSGVAGVYALSTHDQPQAHKPLDAATSPIVRGTLSGVSKASGTLSYADARDLSAGAGGVVTWLPAAGTQVTAGQPLFAVDNVNVYLMHGAIPAWRAFSQGMDAGPDVKQLEQNLATLGYFKGTPDDEFTWASRSAIQAWQKATGQTVTGTIDFGSVVFQPGDVRISSAKAAIGDPVGGGSVVVSVTGLTKQVQVNLALANQQLATLGGIVSIDLPNGKTTGGTVLSVGVPTEIDGATGKSVVIPVFVTLTDPASTGELQQADVTVSFPSETRKDVLSVPVEALLALPDNHFGVDVLQPDGTTRRSPVKTGLFAAGRVEISGDGIAEGKKVVVPKI